MSFTNRLGVVGEPADMAGVVEPNDGRSGSLRHEELLGRIDEPILARDRVPGREVVPRDGSGRTTEDREACRSLARVELSGLLRAQILSEELREERGVDEREREWIKDEVVDGVGLHEAFTQTEDRLTLVGHECGGEHEPEHIGPAERDVGDHDPTVRMADQDLLAGDAVESRCHDGGVAGDRGHVERRCDGAVAVLLQDGGDLVPTRRPGPRAVDEDDRRAVAGGKGVLGQCGRREDREKKQRRRREGDRDPG